MSALRAARNWLRVALALLACCGAGPAPAADVDAFQLAGDGVDIPVTRYAAPGKSLILWLPSEFGVLEAERLAARHLSEKGYETWIADLYDARFLPPLPSSADALPPQDVARLIGEALRRSHKRVYLLTAGRGAKYALEGARRWQAARPAKTGGLAGAVLLFPNLYQNQPGPGEDPVYLPVASDTRLRIRILQGELSPWYWTLDTLQATLARGGSKAGVSTFPGVRDRFYFRGDATAAERALGQRLPDAIIAEIKKLETLSRSTK